MSRALHCLTVLAALSLVGCGSTTPDEVAANLALWLIFVVALLLLALVGAAVVVMVLLAPPFAGLVSGLLLRRDASPRRRGVVVAAGLLNLSNLALFSWPFLALVQAAMQPPPAEGLPVESLPVEGLPPTGLPVEPGSADDLVLLAIGGGVLLAINLAVGIYSIAVGLRTPEEGQ
jgi:hypothetical protein